MSKAKKLLESLLAIDNKYSDNMIHDGDRLDFVDPSAESLRPMFNDIEDIRSQFDGASGFTALSKEYKEAVHIHRVMLQSILAYVPEWGRELPSRIYYGW